MIDEVFYSFLSGISLLFGLDPTSISYFRTETGQAVSLFLEIAVCCGLVNTFVFLGLKYKSELDFKLIASIAIPAFIFEFFCKSYFIELLPGLRSASWIILGFSGFLYMLSGVDKLSEKRMYFYLVATAYFIPLNGSLSILCIVFILFKTVASPKRAVTNTLLALLPLILLRISQRVFSSLSTPSADFSVFSFSLVFIVTAFGAALGIFLLFKFLALNKLKAPINLSALAALSLLFFTSRYGNDLSGVQLYKYKFSSMGTVCELTLWGNDKKALEVLFKEAETVFDAIENRLSTYKPESEISILNKSAHEKPYVCSDVLWQNLMLAKHGWELSDGAFDVTIGPLVKLWAIKKKRSELPTKEEIDEALNLIGFDKLILDEKMKSVKFPRAGFKIDFGGLTKGWAVDRARDFLISKGVTQGIINHGGNIYCFGNPPKGKDFYTIGIKNPRYPEKLAGKLQLLGESISTSGNYEQFIIINGVRYTHLIDPRSGMPVGGVDSVSVVVDSAAMSDVLSTAIFVGGASLRSKLKKELIGLNYLFIDLKEAGEHSIEKFGPVFDSIKIEL